MPAGAGPPPSRAGIAARSDERDGGDHGDDRERRGHGQYGADAVGDRLGTVPPERAKTETERRGADTGTERGEGGDRSRDHADAFGGRDPHGDRHDGCAGDPAARSPGEQRYDERPPGGVRGDQQGQCGQADLNIPTLREAAALPLPTPDEQFDELVSAVVDRIRGGLRAG
ncbi:hypothetical protein [Streptomyces sp. gb14]|uniref:hypothetical protein n=1 Tax=Streptomyces sp. gb14 TaxID=1827753 RepID=UPI00211D2BD0|nr:hypothetical protein [Streptomyces sp. gb14]